MALNYYKIVLTNSKELVIGTTISGIDKFTKKCSRSLFSDDYIMLESDKQVISLNKEYIYKILRQSNYEPNKYNPYWRLNERF